MHLTVKCIFLYIITTTIAAYSVFCGFFSPFCLAMHCQAPEKRTTSLFLTQQQMAQCHCLLLQAENLKGNIAEKKRRKKNPEPRLLVPQLPLIPGVKLRKFSICLRAKRAIIISNPMQTHNKH